MLDKLIKIASLSGAFLVFCGVLKLIIYFSAFNIEIIDFLSLSEITKSFLDDINILIMFGVLMLVQTFVVLHYLGKKTNLSIEQFFIQVLSFVYFNKWKYIRWFSLAIIVGIGLLSFSIINYNYFVIYLLIFCIIQILTFIMLTKDENNEIDIPIPSLVILVFITIISSIYLFAKHDIQITNANNKQVIITTTDTIIVCNKSTKLIYVGKTDNFIFIKNATNSASSSFQMSNVKKIEFQ